MEDDKIKKSGCVTPSDLPKIKITAVQVTKIDGKKVRGDKYVSKLDK